MDISRHVHTREAVDLRRGDASSTVALLRGTDPIPAPLRGLIADVLEGKRKVSAKPRRPHQLLGTRELRYLIEFWAALLRGDQGTPDHLDAALSRARAAGWNDPPDRCELSKGEAAAAARAIVADELGITVHQLDEGLHPRRARQKTREK